MRHQDVWVGDRVGDIRLRLSHKSLWPSDRWSESPLSQRRWAAYYLEQSRP